VEKSRHIDAGDMMRYATATKVNLVRLAGTLRQDFIFTFCTRHSKFPFPPSVDVSGPFQPQDSKSTRLWIGIYGRFFTVIDAFRPLGCILSIIHCL